MLARDQPAFDSEKDWTVSVPPREGPGIMASTRRIKISAKSDIQSEYYSQKIVNHNTGKTQIVDKPAPEHWSKFVSAVGNPADPEKYASKKDSQGEPGAKEVETKEPSPEKVIEGYDTSQL